MFNFKLIISIVLMTCMIANGLPETDEVDPCLIQRKCSTTEDIVWATDNSNCYLFRNPCIYTNDMCQRRKEQKTELNIVTKAECKEKCTDFCPENYFPSCGEYNNTLETFSNQCEFLRISCQNDKSYIFLHNGKCEEPADA